MGLKKWLESNDIYLPWVKVELPNPSMTDSEDRAPTSAELKLMLDHRGTFEYPINPIAQGIAANASFVARGFAGDMKHLVELLKSAFSWKGFALVDILQPCVTFNKVNTYDYYRTRVYKLEDEGHDASSLEAAFRRAGEWEDRIPIGVFYRQERPM